MYDISCVLAHIFSGESIPNFKNLAHLEFLIYNYFWSFNLLNQYSPVPRARSSIAGKDAMRAQIYAGLGKCQPDPMKSAKETTFTIYATQNPFKMQIRV